jgi:Ni/Fe-hydrogenase subunit HybB-like protein
MNGHALPVGGELWTRPYKALAGVAALGVAFMLWRYLAGLGATTGLNDGHPWGIWIAFDVVTGTALGCGGYAVAILVYILNKGQYHPIVRSAILTSALGYSLAGFAIVVDVGRFWNIYRVPVFFWQWNLNSALLEVALCVMAYVGVLWIEMAPPVLERWGEGPNPRLRGFAEKTLPGLNRAMMWIVALALLLPTMHQSSLGTVMILAGLKLHPLWQTPLLPVLFLLSVVGMGYAVVVFESTLSSWLFDRRFETRMLGSLARVMAYVTFVYVALRFTDLAFRGALRLTVASGWLSFFFWLEMELFLVPSFLAFSARVRSNPGSLFQIAMMLLLAGGLYRFDTYLVAFNPGAGRAYFPAIPELFITIGLLALEVMAYIYFIRRFPVLPAEHAAGWAAGWAAERTAQAAVERTAQAAVERTAQAAVERTAQAVVERTAQTAAERAPAPPAERPVAATTKRG